MSPKLYYLLSLNYRIQPLHEHSYTIYNLFSVSKEYYCRRGWVPDVFNSVAQKLNFTYSLQVSRDGGWGSIDNVSDSDIYWEQCLWLNVEWFLERWDQGHNGWGCWCRRCFFYSSVHKDYCRWLHSSIGWDFKYFLSGKSRGSNSILIP